MAKAIESMESYSYQYNVQIVGVPELRGQESAVDTSNLCIKLFSEVGANVSLQDLDIAHRVLQRNGRYDTTKPIVCMFVRRLAKDVVMARRNDVCRVNPTNLRFPSEVSLGVSKTDLTPKTPTKSQ